MNDFYYSIVLFLHIAGVLGFFVALGFEWTGLRQIGSAISTEQVRGWMGILKSVRRAGFISMLATIISGILMMVMDPGGAAWIFVSLGALVLVIMLSAALSGPRMAAIGQALAAGEGPETKTFHSLANHPILRISIQTRVAVTLAIVFLMTVKPDFVGSLITIGVAIVLGLASALPMSRRVRAQEGPAD